MKISALVSIGSAFVIGSAAHASVLIFSDNFDGPDNTNFDSADPTGTARRAGTAATDIRLRSSRRQHQISGNQLDFGRPGGGSGRLRFHQDNAGVVSGDWFDWSAGTVGSQITTAGGFRVEFDWTPANDSDGDWVSWNVGFPQAAEPTVRVNNLETDFGILFRHNGGTQHFHNAADATTAGSFTATLTQRHVVIDFAFTSWDDGSDVVVTASVDGTEVLGRRRLHLRLERQ
jgi:hypothetical protein